MPYAGYALLSILVFALVHLFAEKARGLEKVTHGGLLSAGGGVAIAYVFIDLLPKLNENDSLIRNQWGELLPYVEHHAYIMALAGFLLFFGIDRSNALLKEKISFPLALFSYSFFNFLVGYAVVDKNNPEVQPLVLFTIAMGLHYFVNDFSLSEKYGIKYQNEGRWILILSLLLGWFTGFMITLSAPAIALVSAFIGGGVILNVTRHELPKKTPHSFIAFCCSALLYTFILLTIGS